MRQGAYTRARVKFKKGLSFPLPFSIRALNRFNTPANLRAPEYAPLRKRNVSTNTHTRNFRRRSRNLARLESSEKASALKGPEGITQ